MVQSFSGALQRFQAQGDQRGQLMALAYLIEAAVFTGHPAADLSRWLDAAHVLLAQLSGNRYYAFAKATLWMQVALGHFAGAGNLQKGLSACRNAMLLAKTIDDDTLTVNATIIQAFGLSLTGEFAAAQKALVAIEPLVTDAAYPESRALKNIVLMELVLSTGDLDRAQDLQNANREDIEKFGLLFLYPIHVDLSGLLQIHQGRFDAVGHTANHLEDVATLAANPFYSGLALRLRALKAYHQGRFAHACRWAEQAVAVIGQSLGESVHLFRSRLIFGMGAYHLKDLADARQALESAGNFFKRVSSHLSLAETCLGLSLVARAMDDGAKADRHLTSALTIAARQGYEAFPMLSAHDLLAACTPALTLSRSEFADTARRLMDRVREQNPLPCPQDGPDLAGQRPPAAVRHEANRSIFTIRTLGGFEVHRNGNEVISDTQWAGLRQKLLLKAIVVNGCREIPKDILMDALWPDCRYDAALKRFKVTLHRLRKILEPNMDQRAGSSCISLKDNLVSLDTGRCRVDINAFLAACDEVRQLKHCDAPRRLAACRRAVEFYGGDFLPEEPYLRWVEMKRAALKDQYIAVRMEMARIYEGQGELEAAVLQCNAVIQADPLTEHAHQQRMRLLQRQGRCSAALKTYRDLAETLAEELDTVPDPATTRIYKEILGK
jgi:DNA-binding SARP family transcriptional activator